MLQVYDGSTNVETVDLQPDFDQEKAGQWHFRFYFHDEANGNTAYAADDPVQFYGITFRVKNGDSIFNAYDASEPNALGRFLDAIRIAPSASAYSAVAVFTNEGGTVAGRNMNGDWIVDLDGMRFVVPQDPNAGKLFLARAPFVPGQMPDIFYPVPSEPPADRPRAPIQGTTPEGNPIYGPEIVTPGDPSEPPYSPPIGDPIDLDPTLFPPCECFVAPCECGGPLPRPVVDRPPIIEPPYMPPTGFPSTPPPSVPITGGNGGNGGNGRSGPGLVFWALIGAGIYVLTKD